MTARTAGRTRRTRTRIAASVVVRGPLPPSPARHLHRQHHPDYTGPNVTDVALEGLGVPGGSDHLLLTVSLPSTTTAELVEGATSSLDLASSGTQRDGVAR